MFRLVQTCHGDTDVVVLGLGELGEFGTELVEVEAGDFFVEFLG